MDNQYRLHRHLLRNFLIALLLIGVVAGLFWWRKDHQNIKKSNSTETVAVSQSSINYESSNVFNKSKYSLNDPTSPWAVVNKGRALPEDYVPADLVIPELSTRSNATADEKKLRQDAAAALSNLFSGAKQAGYNLMIASGYRSYATQVAVYNAEVKNNGQAVADTESARPGHSEHQTGLAVDVEPANRSCEIQVCFADTQEGKWVAANAYKYGFTVRYPKDKQMLTGYSYEPWHLRYLGSDLAAELNRSGRTLEQFFSLSTYSDYPATSYELRIGN